MFWFFGPEACGTPAPWPGVEPARPALEGEVSSLDLQGSPTCVVFSCGMRTSSCSMADLIPWPEIEPRPLHWERGPLGKSPSHILIVCLFVCLSEKCSWSAMKQGRETNSRALIQEMTTKGKKQVSGTEWCSFSLCPIPTNQKRLRKDAKPQIPSDLKKQTKRTRIQSWENSWKHLVECSIYSHRQGLNLCTGRATEARSQSESPTCAEFRLWGAGSQGRACPWLGGGDPTPQLGRNEVRKESLSSFCHCL